jgi:hypothetical protein
MVARAQKPNSQRVFVPIIPLNSRASSIKEKENTLAAMTAKNPLLQDLISVFDFQA